ncbi:hypothetical protein E8E11_001770 [Didymella keratinophila]|nr:hypothetical protein E8E11_001770 [Didymella keratinophila]
MSSYQGNVPFAELPDTSRRQLPARYHSNRLTSGANTPNSNSALSSGQASGIYTFDSYASNNDWNIANEMEHHAYPTRPVAPNPHHWQAYAETQQQQRFQQQQPPAASFHATVATAAIQTQHYYAPSHPSPLVPRGTEFVPDCDLVAPVAPLAVPESAVGVVKEVTLEPQSASTKRRVSFTPNTQPPDTTIQTTAGQTLASTDQPHTVTLDRLRAISFQVQSGSGEAHEPVQRDFTPQNGKGTLPVPKLSRRGSFRLSVRKVGQGLLTALRMGEPPVVFKADDTIADWKTYLSEFNQKEEKMEEAFDPFQDSIENALNAKYKEFFGEGKFLIDEREEVELSAEVPIELPVQEAEVVPTEDADTWLAHRKAEEAFSEARDPYTGSARHRLSASELVVHPPKPRTYPVGPEFLRAPLCRACSTPCSTETTAAPRSVGTESIEPDSAEDDQHYSTPDSAESPEPEAEAEAVQPKTPSPPPSRLPRAASVGRSRKSVSRRTPPNRRQSTAQPVEESTTQARKDSAQTESPTKPAAKPLGTSPAQSHTPSRDSERYAKIQNGNQRRRK